MIALRCRLLCVLVFAFIFGCAERARAGADSTDTDQTLSPYFYVENGDPRIDRLPLDSTKVDVAVSGVIADVTVTQHYRNDGKRPINVRYVFPASTRAAVHGLRMTIGTRTVIAKIKERAAARAEFEASKKAGKTASLLEEDRPNVFTMNLANVMPRDEIDVTLRYTELLVPTDGSYEFVYPSVVGPRYANVAEKAAQATSAFVKAPYLPEGAAPASTFELSGTLSTPIPISHLESPTHQIRTNQPNTTLARFSLGERERHGNNRDFILRYGLSGGSIEAGLSTYDSGGEKFFLLVVEPPKRVVAAQVPPREYVFVLDVSGSMEGFPLDTAKQLLRELTAKLRPIDRFNVILFSGASHLWSPRSLPATKENVKSALDDLSLERGGGGTELLPALQRALALPAEANLSRSFVVITDGYIEADKNAIDLVRSHLGAANVFSFGIGSSVNRYLIEGVAKAGQGEPFVLTDPRAAKETAERFAEYVSTPVLTRVNVKYEGFDAYDVEPKDPPDVFAERPVVIHGKFRGNAEGTITVSGVSGYGPYAQRFDVAASPPRAENRALEYLWARSRIENLSDFGFGEVKGATKSQITALGLKYSLLTKYTSFIAVSEVVRNPRSPAADVDQPEPLPAGVSADAVGESMQGAPEPPLIVLLLSMLIALGAAVLVRYSMKATVFT